MALLNDLLSAQGGGLVKQLAANFNLDENTTQAAIRELMPALTRGVQKNSADSAGMDTLIKVLGSGKHQKYVDSPDRLIRSDTVEDGNNILGHIFGSKDVSRAVASQAAASTGLESGILKQMLPMLAAAAMGMMSKKAATGSNNSGMGGMLTSFLDADGDGSIADDLFGMAKKFF